MISIFKIYTTPVSKGFSFDKEWRCEEGDYITKWFWHRVGYFTKNASKDFRFHNYPSIKEDTEQGFSTLVLQK